MSSRKTDAAPAKATAKGGRSPKRASAQNGNGQRRRRDREKTITDILDAAERLLDEKGPDGFGLAELGREADVSFGLIHHYFGGKEGLLKAVIRRAMRANGDEIRKLQADGSFWRRDAPAVLSVFDAYAKRPAFGRLMAWGLLTGLLDNDEVEDEFKKDREALDEMLNAFREEAPERLRDDVRVMTALLFSSVLGYTLMRPRLESGYDWTAEEDERFRSLLADAMAGLTRRSRD